MASGNRYRRAHLDGAGSSGTLERGYEGALRRAAARSRQGHPGHKGHEERSVALIESLCDRFKLPSEYRELSVIVARYHGNVHRAFELRANTILGMLEKTDAFRRPERFAQALLACEADSRGRLGLEEDPYPQRQYLQAARDAAATIKPTPEDIADQVGPLIAERIHQRRLRAITELTSSRPAMR
jgi:tRNA nucleotidyltransferase (CCA-adding enzyme)